MNPDRRLIEELIPIREISAQSAREKSIRKGHISTLLLWWARRPLVAARAAVFASLINAPDTYQKRTCLKKTMVDLCRWEAGEQTIEKAKKKILEAQRERLNLPADTLLDKVPPPKVLDIFAGGGAIPLEALRLGCETYAIDLNPVARIIELCTLVYPQKYGKKLADEVEKWGKWVIENVRSEIGDLYPGIPPHPLAPSPTRGEGEHELISNTRREGEQDDKWEISESLRQKMVEVARTLRKEQTPTEAILWQQLRNKKREYKVRRQQPIGAFVVNFYIPQCRLIVVQLELLESSQPKPLNLAKTLTPVAYLWTRTVKCPDPACCGQA